MPPLPYRTPASPTGEPESYRSRPSLEPGLVKYYAMRSTLHGVDTTQLLKGVLDLAVLAVLERSDSYGYDVVRRLREAGLDEVGDASVYGTLRRLFRAGSLTSYVVPSEEGPHRKYYGLNEAGRVQLVRSAKTWAMFAHTMNELLDDVDKGIA
jgi:PadR family transcriptional regulator, regulatory protein PadR